MKQVGAVLWRNYNKSTYNTLEGISAGQYDIRLGATVDFERFFTGEEHYNETPLGGFDLEIVLESFVDPVDPTISIAEYPLTLRYMGEKSKRKDWYISSQRPNTAYPIWVQAGRYPGQDDKSYIIIIKTTDNKYYGRIVLSSEVDKLPSQLKSAISAKHDVGMVIMDSIKTSSEAEKIYNDLIENTNLLMYGPPGTGKTTIMQEVVQIFKNGGMNKIEIDETKDINFFYEEDQFPSSKVVWTTFHQSYSYEEFIISMTTDGSSGKLLDIKPKQGKLLELSEFARDSGKRALLVIDEMNRANVSKVFGEFITIIEPDKRLDEDGNATERTVELQLPYLKDGEVLSFTNSDGTFEVTNPFCMPARVYTIASMNSVDKSIFPLDSALRRRFYRTNLYPNMNILERHYGINGLTYSSPKTEDIQDYRINMFKVLVKDFMNYLNSKVEIFLGADYTLGQSYVWGLHYATEITEGIDYFKNALFEQILPQLEELFRNREEQLHYILGSDFSKLGPYTIRDPSDEEIDLGASISISSNEDRMSNLDVVKWLENILKY